MVSCVLSRQIWFIVLQRLGLHSLAPQSDVHSFEDWWDQVTTRVADHAKQGLNSVIILVAWSLWNHRNRCVFDGRQADLNGLLSSIRDDMYMWELAGAPRDFSSSRPAALQLD